jgi:glycosyltransferase involved in cell wall biosynthesis
MMTTDAVGGVWSYTSELARALCQGGARVLLVVMGPAPQPDLLQSLLNIKELQVKITDLELEWLDPQGCDLEHARRTLMRLADEFRPDIIHLNSFREAAFDWPAPVLVVAHSCVTTWWRACRGGSPDEPRWDIYTSNVAAGLRSADAWAAPTAAFKTEITAAYQPPTPGKVIRNGVSLDIAHQTDKESFVLAAGRLWDEAKNLTTLIAIAPGLPWPVRVAGPRQGPDSLGVANVDQLRWLGQLSRRNLLHQMCRAAIFIAPALYEPFGLTVLEAAACGCALVLADLPSFRELWGDAALFVDPHDPAAISSALHGLCSDKKLRAQLQAAASARAKLYSLSAMAMAYRQLYGEIITAFSRTADLNISVQELRA